MPYHEHVVLLPKPTDVRVTNLRSERWWQVKNNRGGDVRVTTKPAPFAVATNLKDVHNTPCPRGIKGSSAVCIAETAPLRTVQSCAPEIDDIVSTVRPEKPSCCDNAIRERELKSPPGRVHRVYNCCDIPPITVATRAYPIVCYTVGLGCTKGDNGFIIRAVVERSC